MSKSLGRLRQEQVADAAAHEIGDVIVLPQAIENLQRVRVDVAARDRVLGARNDPRLSHRGHCTKTHGREACKCLCFQEFSRSRDVLPSRDAVRRSSFEVDVRRHSANVERRTRWSPCLVPGRAVPCGPVARPARTGASPVQPAAIHRGAFGGRGSRAHPCPRRQREPDCRPRVSRALSRERRLRGFDQRARSSADA